MNNIQEKSIEGCIIGTAIGDAVGLPFEGLNKKRVYKFAKDLKYPKLILNKGMVSDDTEHTCMIAQSIIESKNDYVKFEKIFSNKLKLWFLALPAGIGFATLRSLLKLLIGISPKKSGVFSAGNGPAMRSAILGVCYGNNKELLDKYLTFSTKITHTDSKALYGSYIIAIAAYCSYKAKLNNLSKNNLIEDFSKEIFPLIENDNEINKLINDVIKSVKNNFSTEEFAKSLNLEKGITGYMYHTIPIVIHSWLTNPFQFEKGIKEIILCGGDTDTTAAILGGIIGAYTGLENIPKYWLDNIIEYPRSINWMKLLSKNLYITITKNNQEIKHKKLSAIAIIIRNLLFTIIVLLHGFRRILPPY